jgi:hypothetical protein
MFRNVTIATSSSDFLQGNGTQGEQHEQSARIKSGPGSFVDTTRKPAIPLLNDCATHAGHVNHATCACVLSRSLEVDP